jgi:CheY-like chemotaxis protein
MVVDDESDQRTLVGEMLVPTGYEVESAVHGREALEKHRSDPADLIITDLFMPEFDGVELILALRKESPSVKVIAVSGNTIGDKMLSVARRLGTVAVLEKPFTQEQLLAAIKKIL